jgi:hypothetical protein
VVVATVLSRRSAPDAECAAGDPAGQVAVIVHARDGAISVQHAQRA